MWVFRDEKAEMQKACVDKKNLSLPQDSQRKERKKIKYTVGR